MRRVLDRYLLQTRSVDSQTSLHIRALCSGILNTVIKYWCSGFHKHDQTETQRWIKYYSCSSQREQGFSSFYFCYLREQPKTQWWIWIKFFRSGTIDWTISSCDDPARCLDPALPHRSSSSPLTLSPSAPQHAPTETKTAPPKGTMLLTANTLKQTAGEMFPCKPIICPSTFPYHDFWITLVIPQKHSLSTFQFSSDSLPLIVAQKVFLSMNRFLASGLQRHHYEMREVPNERITISSLWLCSLL